MPQLMCMLTSMRAQLGSGLVFGVQQKTEWNAWGSLSQGVALWIRHDCRGERGWTNVVGGGDAAEMEDLGSSGVGTLTCNAY